MYLSFQLTDSAFVSYCRKEGETHHEKGGFSDTAFGVVHLTDGHKKGQKAQKQPKSFVLVPSWHLLRLLLRSQSHSQHPKCVKTLDRSAKGAKYGSLGHRPRKGIRKF